MRIDLLSRIGGAYHFFEEGVDSYDINFDNRIFSSPHLTSAQRKEIPEIPVAVIREVLANIQRIGSKQVPVWKVLK